MISWKLVIDNRKNNYGIFMIIILCVMVVLASLLYINQSLKNAEDEIVNKYGDISAVIFTENKTDDFQQKLDSFKEIDFYVGMYRKIVTFEEMRVMLHVVDFDKLKQINDINTIDGEKISAAKGLYFENKEIGINNINTNTTLISLKINETDCVLGFGGILDKKSYYEITNSTFFNIYMDKEQYEKNFGKIPNYDVYYLKIAGEGIENVNAVLQQFDEFATKNIASEKMLKSKESDQSFIYAVSFIIIGLIGIVLGGLYYFSQSMIQENIRQISFFRTLGLNHKEATKLYWQQMIEIGMISEVVGVVCGTVLGNIIWTVNYGFQGIIPPKLWMIILTIIIAIILPYLFIKKEINKVKNNSPIRLLLEYRSGGYSVEKDKIEKYYVFFILYFLLIIFLFFIKAYLPDTLLFFVNCLEILFIINAFQSLSIILLEMISKISKIILEKKLYLGYAIRNLSRNKNKIGSIIGILILTIAFEIAMYNVFYTIRWDTVEKVEQQYNADVFLSDFNSSPAKLDKEINQISNLKGNGYIETSNTRYLYIKGRRIEGYFLSPEEFDKFFSLEDVSTGTKAVLSNNKNCVVIGKGLAQKGNIKVGDKITLSDYERDFDVVVTSICNSSEYQGNVVFLNESFYNYPINQVNIIFESEITVQEGIENIYSLYDDDAVLRPNITSKNQLKENYRLSAIKGTMFIEVILILIVTAGILMLLNQQNLILNERKREYNLFYTLGASYKEINFIFIIENLCIFFIGLLGGIFAGIMITGNFVDLATYTSGITNVLSYYYDNSNIWKISLYVITIYIIFQGFILGHMKKRISRKEEE